MRFMVDELPYYEEDCVVAPWCPYVNDPVACPRKWSKYMVTSDTNPHECHLLAEQKGENK